MIGLDGEEGKGSGALGHGRRPRRRRSPGSPREGLIQRGGGHRMAAGLTLAPGQLEPAMARLGELLAAPGRRRREPARSLRLDGLLAPGGATPELADAHRRRRPLRRGIAPRRGSRSPARASPGVRRIGDGHLALALADGAGGRLDAIAFRALEGPLGAFLSAGAAARRAPRRPAGARRLGRPARG